MMKLRNFEDAEKDEEEEQNSLKKWANCMKDKINRINEKEIGYDINNFFGSPYQTAPIDTTLLEH